MVNERLKELGGICSKCVAPTRHPGCQDHCEIGIEMKMINHQEREERYRRKEAEYANRSYIRDMKERMRRKRGIK